MTDDRKAMILHELDQFSPAPRPMRETDITVSDVMAKYNISMTCARSWLKEHVEAGRLIQCEALDTNAGRRVKVYRIPEGE